MVYGSKNLGKGRKVRKQESKETKKTKKRREMRAKATEERVRELLTTNIAMSKLKGKYSW